MKVLLTLLVFFFIPSYVCSETVNYLNEDDSIAEYDRSTVIQRSGQVSGIKFSDIIDSDNPRKGLAVIRIRVRESTAICTFSDDGKTYFTSHIDTLEPNYDGIVAGVYSAMKRNFTVTVSVDNNCRITHISFDRDR